MGKHLELQSVIIKSGATEETLCTLCDSGYQNSLSQFTSSLYQRLHNYGGFESHKELWYSEIAGD